MKIKHYTFFSDSHAEMLKYFLSTYPYDNTVDLTIRKISQDCESASYNEEGWKTTMLKKIDYILDGFEELSENDIMVHTDVDIVFVKPFINQMLNELQSYDIAFQNDQRFACMGLFICKTNKTVKNLFLKIRENFDKHENDQIAANYYLRSQDNDVKFTFLSKAFFNYGFIGERYRGEDNVDLPENILMLHANFTIGVENKKKLLNIAYKKFYK